MISEDINEEVIEEIEGYSIPFVYLNKFYKVSRLPSVSIDNYEASTMMTEYLLKLGHKNILYVTASEDQLNSVEKDKIEGYKNTMNRYERDELILSAEGFAIEDGYNIGNDLEKIMRRDNITAAFCCQDEIAIGLINYCYDNEIKVPEHISICGYGDTKMASIYRPGITTIKEPYYDIGAVAIRRIIKELEGDKAEDKNTYLPIQLMERESCRRI